MSKDTYTRTRTGDYEDEPEFDVTDDEMSVSSEEDSLLGGQDGEHEILGDKDSFATKEERTRGYPESKPKQESKQSFKQSSSWANWFKSKGEKVSDDEDIDNKPKPG
ncbi:MAG: hypothetical protein P1U74_08210 [Legionellaceae bacterium]|nr:hypothetical protein [Legionellaceae bacterium]